MEEDKAPVCPPPIFDIDTTDQTNLTDLYNKMTDSVFTFSSLLRPVFVSGRTGKKQWNVSTETSERFLRVSSLPLR